MGKFKPKTPKKREFSGPNVYSAALQDASAGTSGGLISRAAKAGTRLVAGRSAAGSRLGASGDQRAVRGRSDAAQSALTDKKKKKTGQEAEASIIGSTGKKLGA